MTRNMKKPEECTALEECRGGRDSEMRVKMNDREEVTFVGCCSLALLPLYSRDITVLGETKQLF